MDRGKEVSDWNKNYNKQGMMQLFLKEYCVVRLTGLMLPNTKVLRSIFMYVFIHNGILFFTGRHLQGELIFYVGKT
jgi:hypothetical protein